MGNDASKPPGYNRLFAALPSLYNHGLGNDGLSDANTKIWVDNSDRDQFICMYFLPSDRHYASPLLVVVS